MYLTREGNTGTSAGMELLHLYRPSIAHLKRKIRLIKYNLLFTSPDQYLNSDVDEENKGEKKERKNIIVENYRKGWDFDASEIVAIGKDPPLFTQNKGLEYFFQETTGEDIKFQALIDSLNRVYSSSENRSKGENKNNNKSKNRIKNKTKREKEKGVNANPFIQSSDIKLSFIYLTFRVMSAMIYTEIPYREHRPSSDDIKSLMTVVLQQYDQYEGEEANNSNNSIDSKKSMKEEEKKSEVLKANPSTVPFLDYNRDICRKENGGPALLESMTIGNLFLSVYYDFAINLYKPFARKLWLIV